VLEAAPSVARLEQAVGFIPTSYRVLAHRPEILEPFRQLAAAVLGNGTVEPGLKSLVALMVSTVTGCRYCQAHQGHSAVNRGGVEEAKILAIWEFETDPLFSPAERAALRMARDSAVIPNAVTDAHFEELRKHFADPQIVELVSAASLFGFLNRFNDTMANDLEDHNIEWASAHMAEAGWEVGKHAPQPA
jgi:uncharacterized peroxidase-related enzyme